MWKNSAIGKLWCFLKEYKKSVFIIFEMLWWLLLWIISPFISDGLALVIPPLAAFAISLVFVACISPMLALLKKKYWFDLNAFGPVIYSAVYLLTLYLTLAILQKVTVVFNISTVEQLGVSFQIIAFLLYIVFFCAFRNPTQMQYWAYAIAYGFFIVWEWNADWNVIGTTLLDINAELALKLFIIPFKEAMLLFIILDTFLKARNELKQEKRLCNEEEKIR